MKQKRASGSPVLLKNDGSVTWTESLRTVPYEQNADDEALRTVPLKECANVLSDEEDAMSTSAGSSDVGLAESHTSSFAEADEQQIPRALLLMHRQYVQVSETLDYSLRAIKMASEHDPAAPPGLMAPPGLEYNFEPPEFRMPASINIDKGDLQGLLQKIAGELGRLSTSSTATASENEEPPLQDWVFTPPGLAGDSKEATEDVMQSLATWAANPSQKPLETQHDCNIDSGITAISISDELTAQDHLCPVDIPYALLKTGWDLAPEADQSMDFGMMAAASDCMAWPECYNGLCTDWPQAVTQAEIDYQEWFPCPWATYNTEWDVSYSGGF